MRNINIIVTTRKKKTCMTYLYVVKCPQLSRLLTECTSIFSYSKEIGGLNP